MYDVIIAKSIIREQSIRFEPRLLSLLDNAAKRSGRERESGLRLRFGLKYSEYSRRAAVRRCFARDNGNSGSSPEAYDSDAQIKLVRRESRLRICLSFVIATHALELVDNEGISGGESCGRETNRESVRRAFVVRDK